MQLTEDVDDFLARAGDFLRSRPALHTTPLTTLEKLRTHGSDGTVFGWLEDAFCYLRPSGRLTLTSLAPEQVATVVALWAGLGRPLSGVIADHDTATAFAEAWQQRTGASGVPGVRVRLHRLGTLTPPEPVPEGRARVLGTSDRAEIVRWCVDFAATVGEALEPDAWDASRFGDKHYVFWETDGPVAMAGSTSMVAGMVRVDPVYTPAHLRGRGYAGAVTMAVSRAALAAGATDVVLYTNPDNATSNALYRRIGYVPIADFTGYDFG
ncbi:GNAT family N-acetyltransferase [Amycolatopsis sp., V23-08]|uniref:GNAT family N-acetyltransferase n=1 Tax=Amycolatopsis heterodermiae TaxID=3110235 RepID=A0ABU5R1Z6_9PSEU|nr:GNAT family N-acetyltransferase [Amycolatopsis sp., V23-08]MEA5359724.1 GNAT family N-acetyltransferase [Amycolatopsis sp., V23-08]